jgi:transcriptional regulator with XRE-family HTH domain
MQKEFPVDLATQLQKLRLLVKSKAVTQTEISLATHVDQSQVSRILAGQTRRVSTNVIELCKFAISLDGVSRDDPARNDVLMGALRAVWDGSPSQAEAIASVLLSLRKFKETTA